MKRLYLVKAEADPNDEFQMIYVSYAGLVRGVLYRLCGATDLDDLVQETFVKVWQALPGFRGQSSMKTWIYRIAYRTGVDGLRGRGRHGRLAPIAADTPAVAHDPDTDTQRAVMKSLEALSEEHRATIVLHCMEGLTLVEVAEITAVPEGTVKSRLHAARKQMQALLEAEGVEV